MKNGKLRVYFYKECCNIVTSTRLLAIRSETPFLEEAAQALRNPLVLFFQPVAFVTIANCLPWLM